jgi:hypothetical protein
MVGGRQSIVLTAPWRIQLGSRSKRSRDNVHIDLPSSRSYVDRFRLISVTENPDKPRGVRHHPDLPQTPTAAEHNVVGVRTRDPDLLHVPLRCNRWTLLLKRAILYSPLV